MLILEYLEVSDFLWSLSLIYFLISFILGIFLLRRVRCPFCKKRLPTDFYPAFSGEKFRDPKIVTFCPRCGIDPETREYRDKEDFISLQEKYPLKESPKPFDYSKTEIKLEDELKKVGFKAPRGLTKALGITLAVFIYYSLSLEGNDLVDKNPHVSPVFIFLVIPILIGFFYFLTSWFLNKYENSNPKGEMKSFGRISIIVLSTLICGITILAIFALKNIQF